MKLIDKATGKEVDMVEEGIYIYRVIKYMQLCAIMINIMN